MRRSEWLEWRRGGIGGSDVAAILGISPWKSPYSLWLDKLTPRTEGTDEGTEAQERGKDLEPVLAKWFHRERPALHVFGEQTMLHHPDNEWARVTVDGFVAETQSEDVTVDDALGAFEGKSTIDSPKRWDEFGIPAVYAAQGQWTMYVSGFDRVWFGVMHPFWQFRVYELDRDEGDIALIVDRCTSFWHDHVLPGVPPPTDGHPATTEALGGITASRGDMIVLPDDIAEKVAALAVRKREAKRLDTSITELENAIKVTLDECTEGFHGDRQVCSWRPQSTTRLDTKALKAAEPAVAAKFSNTTESRVFRLHNQEE